jgi:hypothetical protein
MSAKREGEFWWHWRKPVGEKIWREQSAKAHPRSGRLKVVEKNVAVIAGGQAKGVVKALALCACGNTRVVQMRDIYRGRAAYCGEHCRQRLMIRNPHCSTQRIHSRKTGKLIRLGPPKWDPVLRKGVFSDGVPTKTSG